MIRLWNGSDYLDLTCENGFAVTSFDPGFPTIREVVVPRTDDHGTIDTTALFGSRVVALEISAATEIEYNGATRTMNDIRSALTKFLLPSSRIVMVDLANDRQISLRVSQFTSPYNHPRLRKMQVQWVAPEGVWESIYVTQTLLAAELEVGRTYDRFYNRIYPYADPTGGGQAYNAGDAPAYPVVRIYGPATNPRIENITTNRRSVFSGVTLSDGEYLEIDMLNRTVYLNGDSTQTRLQFLDFAISDWWSLVPGTNQIRYYPESPTATAPAVIIFRSAYL